ncbi:threonine/serine exporter family protein [Leucobacter coleopterorum]|uniref:Threonine/serine exporter family protein n=1 Tax=Leucobacter coleopterorum TaxID=2714933 RepID=A0ABX6JY37_9MICO|nr:threonine/serine exporter family protein [Leucobacter coleopterorum]QIM17700.1 threonine/serine exporter family protein [Leucobacter coleopterorum]
MLLALTAAVWVGVELNARPSSAAQIVLSEELPDPKPDDPVVSQEPEPPAPEIPDSNEPQPDPSEPIPESPDPDSGELSSPNEELSSENSNDPIGSQPEQDQDVNDDTNAGVLELIPSEASVRQVPADTWITALVIVVASALLLLLLQLGLRRSDRRQFINPEPFPAAVPPATPTTTIAAMASVGEAMLDANYSVVAVHRVLDDIARVDGFPEMEVVVFPTALILSSRGGGEVQTAAVQTGSSRFQLHQVDALDRLVAGLRSGSIPSSEARERVRELRQLSSPYSGWLRILAYVVICASIAVLLGASWVGLAFAGALGAVVGTALVFSARAPRRYQPLITVGLAFGVSTAVFLFTSAGWDPGILSSLVAPFVILLPGALLTTGVIELASGEMMSGAGRLAAGSMQLVLLAAGFVAGAMLVGVPQIQLTEAYGSLGPVAPWIAVLLFGVGIVINQGGRGRSIPWTLLVLFIAYGTQVVSSTVFGGVLSAFFGAFAMTPVAVWVSRHPSGPAAMVSFLPAFWLLVPGALGLVGVTSILSGDSAGSTALVTTIATMVSIALGIVAGSVLAEAPKHSRGSHAL